MRVRRAAIMHMRRCPDEFRAFLGSDFDAYLASMSESGVWGDELTLVRGKGGGEGALGGSRHVVGGNPSLP